MRSEPFPDLRVEAALFVLNLDSEATFSGDQTVTTPGRPSHHHGIELSASYKPLPWLRLDGDFAASRARFANIDPGTNDTEPGHPGNYIPNAPMWSRRRTRLPRTSVLGSAGIVNLADPERLFPAPLGLSGAA